MPRRLLSPLLLLLACLAAAPAVAPARAQPYPPYGGDAAVVRQAAGPAAADLQAAVEAFRADLGGDNNGVGGAFPGGRREINWDGVPDARSSPNDLPADFFNTTSPRGAVFVSPAGRFQVSANEGVAAVRFGDINPAYADAFAVFSAQRLFVALDTTEYDVLFFVPGTDTPAAVAGFGAVFTNVRLPGAAAIEYFDAAGASLGRWDAPTSGAAGLSFLGVSFPGAPHIARVRLTAGTLPLGPYAADSDTDNVVAIDDLLYGEPQP
jgi:hypothetical protein